jgi:hypothetical protein
MENHLPDLARDCSNAVSVCPMIGQCDFLGSRAAIKDHLSKEQLQHTTMMCVVFVRLKVALSWLLFSKSAFQKNSHNKQHCCVL